MSILEIEISDNKPQINYSQVINIPLPLILITYFHPGVLRLSPFTYINSFSRTIEMNGR